MEKYVAYVSSYTYGDKHGIRIFDVDTEKGRFTEKGQIDISNSSYISISHNNKVLYAITDMGVESYKILPDGNLEYMNESMINGMRGCYISTDYNDRFLFVAGYHDGKITVLKLNDDGSVGAICEEIFHRGLGNITERNYRPHVNCVKMTRDNKFLCAADLGMDHVNIYELDESTGKLKLVDVIRCEQESAPRHLKFSENGEYCYIVHEIKNYIDMYRYRCEDGNPFFDFVERFATVDEYHSKNSISTTIKLSQDSKYMVSSSAGNNNVIIYKILEDYKLERILCLPVSGDYPKDAGLFPDNKFLVSLNHESDTMTFFKVDLEAGTIILNGGPLLIEKPNCIIFHKLSE